jgi:NifU-like protein involved in Fe-S cluster formation
MAEVKEFSGNSFIYSQIVEDHFFNPRNVLKNEKDAKKFDAIGEIGSPACGDVMKVYLKIDSNKIVDFKWKTFGCASAIAATSILSEMAMGMNIDDAYQITASDITQALGGLPKRKIHCSVLGDQALRLAIDNYKKSK